MILECFFFGSVYPYGTVWLASGASRAALSSGRTVIGGSSGVRRLTLRRAVKSIFALKRVVEQWELSRDRYAPFSLSIPAKKMNAPRKMQKNNNLKNIKYKISTKRGPVFTFSLPGGRLAPCPPSITPLALLFL